MSSAIASNSISRLECFARCITALVCSDISKPSQGAARLGPVDWGMWFPAPPRSRCLMFSVPGAPYNYWLSGVFGFSGFHELLMYQSEFAIPARYVMSMISYGVRFQFTFRPWTTLPSTLRSIVLVIWLSGCSGDGLQRLALSHYLSLPVPPIKSLGLRSALSTASRIPCLLGVLCRFTFVLCDVVYT